MATYSGDSNNAGSSGTLTQVVTLPATTTTVTSSLNPSTVGRIGDAYRNGRAGRTAHPDGNGELHVAGTAHQRLLGNVTLSSSRTAACTTSTLPVGTDAIVATYSGDTNYAGSSGTFSQLVNPIPTAVQFFPVTPCRVVDTRNADGPFGGPELTAGETSRSFTIPAGPCAGIPTHRRRRIR